MPLEVAEQLWRWFGFAALDDEAVAFTDADVEALQQVWSLMQAGIISTDSQAALVRTWGRSFARLAEWQADLLAEAATEAAVETGRSGAPAEDALEGAPARLEELSREVLPRLEALQSYAWRRHLAGAAGRLLSHAGEGDGSVATVCFVDIVGYTTRSKALAESELVDWLEHFEDHASAVVVEAGGRIIKTIGDEILFVTDDPRAAADAATALAARGEDPDDPFPRVRAGLAHGSMVHRLGDVYGATVNLAARLTSVARPGAVLLDQGAHDVLCPDHGEQPGDPPYRLRRVRRISVKGYARLPAWSLRAPA